MGFWQKGFKTIAATCKLALLYDQFTSVSRGVSNIKRIELRVPLSPSSLIADNLSGSEGSKFLKARVAVPIRDADQARLC
jgi:hypothetical protein